MPTHIPGAVPLADIAKQLRTTVAKVEEECRALDIFVGVDWAGRPAVTDVEAYALVTGDGRKQFEHNRAWQAHAREAEAWQRARDEAVQIASSNAYRQASLAFEPNGKAQTIGHEAGREAGRRYEEQHPAPTWDEATSLAQRRYTSGDSVFRRALDRVVGGVA